MSQLSFLSAMVTAAWNDRRFTDDSLSMLQARKLRRLVADAQKNVPYQRRRLNGINPSDPDLTQIEPVSKKHMMDRFNDTVANGAVNETDVDGLANRDFGDLPIIRGRYLVSMTSGTNGESGRFVNDLNSWGTLRGATFGRTMRGQLGPHSLFRFAFGRRCRIAFLVTDCPYSASVHAAKAPMTIGRLCTQVRLFSVHDSIDRTIEQLNRYRPHYLHCYPTSLDLIAQKRIDGVGVNFDPEVVSFGSEAVLPTAKSRIEAAFPRSQLMEEYGTTECIPLAHLCEAGTMHVNADYCMVEAVDVNGNPVAVGEYSDHILITNLVNTCQPVIRYRLDDSVRFLPGRCACGRVLPAIELRGRADDVFTLLDDTGKRHEVSPLRMAVSLHPIHGLGQFQATHVSQNSICLKFTVRGDKAVETLRREIYTAISGTFESLGIKDRLTLTVEPVDTIERVGRGQKMRQFISQL